MARTDIFALQKALIPDDELKTPLLLRLHSETRSWGLQPPGSLAAEEQEESKAQQQCINRSVSKWQRGPAGTCAVHAARPPPYQVGSEGRCRKGQLRDGNVVLNTCMSGICCVVG